MSGGYFSFSPWIFESIADEIQELIETNKDNSIDEWGDTIGRFYSKDTINEFKESIDKLRIAQIYMNRIDYLVSGDDSEESFHERLNEELKQYKLQ